MSLEKLDPSLALYWSCLAKYLTKDEERKEDAAETLERLLPSVSELCTYIEM